MRNLSWTAVAAMAIWSVSLAAQEVTAGGQQGGAPASSGAQGNSVSRPETNVRTAEPAEMRRVIGELQTKLNSKTAKIGDAVIVKTTEKVMTAQGVELGKGTRLVGHVIEVQPYVKGQPGSQLAIGFDRAELKEGQVVAIRAVIRWVSSPVDTMNASSGDDPTKSPMPEMARANNDPLANARTMLGGSVSSVVRSAGQDGSVLETPMSSKADIEGRPGANAGGIASGTGEATGGAGPRAMGIPGVMLKADATGAASGVFTLGKSNVELEPGTVMTLGVSAKR